MNAKKISIHPLYGEMEHCEACDTPHIAGPCEYGRCRKCGFPLGEKEPDRPRRLETLRNRASAKCPQTPTKATPKAE